MILASTVYDTVLALAKKDRRGRGFNIDEYNTIAALVNMELYNSYVSKYEIGKEVSDALNPFKVRNQTITLTSGQGFLLPEADRLLGNPWMAHPWGTITATASVDIVNNPDAKVKVTSPNHGLKDGDVVTCTGLSEHTITSEAIHYIDKNSFWVDVDYTAPDTLTSAVWTLTGASYKEVDLVTEEELSNRWANDLSKPTIQNPVAVFDTGTREGFIGSYTGPPLYANTGVFGNLDGAVTIIFGTYGSIYTGEDQNYIRDGDYIYLYGGRDAMEVACGDYDGLHRIEVIDDDQILLPDLAFVGDTAFSFYEMYNVRRINVFPTTIPTVYLNYFRYPDTPFLDYYVNDTSYEITYLDEGETLTNFAAGSTYRDGTAGDGVVDIDSITVNWEWDEDLLPQIAYMMLQKMGINLENMNVTQIASQLELKEQSQI